MHKIGTDMFDSVMNRYILAKQIEQWFLYPAPAYISILLIYTKFSMIATSWTAAIKVDDCD